MILIILLLVLIIMTSYNIGRHAVYDQVFNLIEEMNNFNHPNLVGTKVEYRKGYLDAVFTLLNQVGRL